MLVDGFARGLTILDRNLKAWNAPNAWTERPKVHTKGHALSAAVSPACVLALSDRPVSLM